MRYVRYMYYVRYMRYVRNKTFKKRKDVETSYFPLLKDKGVEDVEDHDKSL